MMSPGSRDLYNKLLDEAGLLKHGAERVPKPALEHPCAGAIPSSPMSTESGPSFVEAAAGFALPAGAPDQVAVMSRGWGGYAMQTPWYRPLPASAFGSYIPTPPLDVFPDAPSAAPFIEPAVSAGQTYLPGFGMGFGSMPWFSEASYAEAARIERTNPLDDPFGAGGEMLNGYETMGSGTLGAESFLSNIADLVGQAGQSVLAYQQQKYEARAKQRYGAPAEFSLVAPQAQAEFANVPEVIATEPTPAAAAEVAEAPFNPLWLAAGGMALFLLMRR